MSRGLYPRGSRRILKNHCAWWLLPVAFRGRPPRSPYKARRSSEARWRNKNLTRSSTASPVAGEEKRSTRRETGRVRAGWLGPTLRLALRERAKGTTAKLVIIRPYFFVVVQEEDGPRTSMATAVRGPRSIHGPLSDHKETKERSSSPWARAARQ